MPILNRREMTKVLKTALTTATGRPIEAIKIPEGSNPAMPYGILYPIGGGEFHGPPLAAPDEDVDMVYQVTSVGREADPQQVEWMADRVRRFFLERAPQGDFIETIPAPEGWKISDRWPDAGLPPIDPETQGLFQVPERFVLRVTPA